MTKSKTQIWTGGWLKQWLLLSVSQQGDLSLSSYSHQKTWYPFQKPICVCLTGHLDLRHNPSQTKLSTQTDSQQINKHCSRSINRSFHELLDAITFVTQRFFLSFAASFMEIRPSAVGGKLVCADLDSAVFFWFDPQRKQLAVAFRIPPALTMDCLYDAVRETLARW